MTEDSSQVTGHRSQVTGDGERGDDALLEQFFAPAREQQMADNGFTERVMHRLPDRAMQLSRLWTLCCLVVGIVFIGAFLLLQGWLPVVLWLNNIVHESFVHVRPLPLFLTMGALCSLAVTELANRVFAEY